MKATDFKTDTETIKDLDCIPTWRGGCMDFQLNYRQVREQIWFQIDPRRYDP